MIKMGDNEIEFNPEFRLYFCTKLSNPKYTPEIMSMTMVINYTVTMDGLKSQLLNVVVGYERPDKEKLRLEVVQTMSENTAKLKQAEDDLLNKLSNAQGNILDDEPLINTLEDTRVKSEAIAQAIVLGKKTQ
jgi:dynein heavy chain